MKKELIKTDNYLLVVDDSEIKVGDYFYVTTKNIAGGNVVSQSIGNGEFAWTEHILSTKTDERGYHPSHCKKIIAHLSLNNSPILEGVLLLPPFEVEDDVEKLAKEHQQGGYEWQNEKRKSFIAGYNKAKEKYKFTEKQIDVAIDWAIKKGREGDVTITDIDNLIQSISQPKIPTHFEFEMEVIGVTDDGVNKIEEPKTTTNSQGQQVVCGKYIYEI